MMITPPAADIALTIPTIIVTPPPPDTAESTELCSSIVQMCKTPSPLNIQLIKICLPKIAQK